MSGSVLHFKLAMVAINELGVPFLSSVLQSRKSETYPPTLKTGQKKVKGGLWTLSSAPMCKEAKLDLLQNVTAAHETLTSCLMIAFP